jgi:FixJ family two-component response regulator
MANDQQPSDEMVRDEIVRQLRESLSRSREMMQNEKLDARTRERWTQLHTNTAQVLNQVLRDQQAKDWEKRLKELEKAGHLPRRISLPGTPKWESEKSGEKN